MPDLKELIASVAEMDDEAKSELRKALELAPEDVFKKLTDATDEQKDALRKALGMEPETDDSLKARVMKLFGLTPTTPEPNKDLPEAVQKVVDEIKASVTKADENTVAVQKKLDDALEVIAKRDKEARVQTMVVKAAKYGTMGSADDVSKLLTDTQEKLGDEGLKALEVMLAKGEEAFKQAKVFEEIGRDGGGKPQGDVMKQIEDKAVEIQKAHKDMSIEDARAEAWRKNPDLYKQYGIEKQRAARAQEG